LNIIFGFGKVAVGNLGGDEVGTSKPVLSDEIFDFT